MTHESIFKYHGCLSAPQKLEYGRPVPRSRTVEGMYVDDHLTVSRVPAHELKDRLTAEDDD